MKKQYSTSRHKKKVKETKAAEKCNHKLPKKQPSPEPIPEKCYKIGMIGDAGVGKVSNI